MLLGKIRKMEKKYTLPREFGEKWVAALRSGNFNQTQATLKDDWGHCCLGVACEIQGAAFYRKKFSFIPVTWGKRFGLPVELLNGELDWTSLPFVLSSMNDKGTPFSQIADWIEANVEFI